MEQASLQYSIDAREETLTEVNDILKDWNERFTNSNNQVNYYGNLTLNPAQYEAVSENIKFEHYVVHAKQQRTLVFGEEYIEKVRSYVNDLVRERGIEAKVVKGK